MSISRIYLVGYMGAGKSSVAKKVANKTGWFPYDLDILFEEKYKISVSDFFRKYGEDTFRKLESELLKKTADINQGVIATGGGTPCFFDNMNWMNENGVTVFLKVSQQTSITRLLHSKKKRPLLQDKNESEMMNFIQEQYRFRMPFYQKAQFEVKGENCDIEQLIQLVFSTDSK